MSRKNHLFLLGIVLLACGETGASPLLYAWAAHSNSSSGEAYRIDPIAGTVTALQMRPIAAGSFGKRSSAPDVRDGPAGFTTNSLGSAGTPGYATFSAGHISALASNTISQTIESVKGSSLVSDVEAAARDLMLDAAASPVAPEDLFSRGLSSNAASTLAGDVASTEGFPAVAVSVPEPNTLALVCAAFAMVSWLRRKKARYAAPPPAYRHAYRTDDASDRFQ
jgi:hypothetical protein